MKLRIARSFLRSFLPVSLASAVCLAVGYLLCWLPVPPVHAQDPEETITVEKIDRTFVVHLPQGYDSKQHYPVVLLLHGRDQTADDMARLSKFDQAADRYGVIAVYPNAYQRRWNVGVESEEQNPGPARRGRRGGFGFPGIGFPGGGVGFPGGGGNPGGNPGGGGGGGAEGGQRQAKTEANDLAFFDAMLDKLSSEYAVDTSRIYATGYSEGGFMAFRLGCSMTSRIAAVAPVAAEMPKAMKDWCSPSRPISLLMINGTSDPVVPYDGSSFGHAGSYPTISAEDTVKQWAKYDSCEGKPEHTKLPAQEKSGMETHVETFSDCQAATAVALYSIEGGGNTWPNGDPIILEGKVGKTSTDLDADDVIWKFFDGHRLPAAGL